MNPRKTTTTTTTLHPGFRHRAGSQVARAAAVACAGTLVLAGCSAGQTSRDTAASPSAETVTVTATAEPGTDQAGAPTTGSPTTEPSPEPTPVECSPESVPVAADAAAIAPPFADRSWAVWSTGNLCGTLGYAELVTKGGTGSSPTQLLLYNEGRFLGTGIKCNALGQVTSSNYDSVTVGYRWPVGDDSNANMTGRASVTFRWNGSSVDMLGELPPEAIGIPC